MQVDTRLVHLYFGRETEELKLDPKTIEIVQAQPRNIKICYSWHLLPELLTLKPKTISFSASELVYTSAIEIVNMVNTLSKLVELDYKVSVSVTVNKNTSYSVIKDLQKSGVCGIIPLSCDFGIDEAIRGCNAQWADIPYWPKHIIDQLPGAKKKINKNTNKIMLTTRQEQILTLIQERGASNKIIAKSLNISESTVKLHVGAVLKKFNVKNRTQLALFGKK